MLHKITNITGQIPSTITKLNTFFFLTSTFNVHLGTIPESFGSLQTELPYLILSHNQLSGSIPKSLGNIDFQSFNVSYNRLCGLIPSLQGFDYYTYFHNKCLCGAPLDSCK
ncbi:hypothetical protein F2Q70_00040977 [Brassica cretica]|uniref:Leucine-rich repeat-containing N-terminal plant-type domain-containing protein n=1 Tax=Brassica cretica TaxID=69181 RepID=A0A8S9K5K0_BRACR|nr:hypothetical protein F2Q70_00040977 [Brassica cretica]